MHEQPAATAFPVTGSNGSVHNLPPPGSPEESFLFKKIQEQFSVQFEKAFPDKLAYKTVIVVPSLTLDQEILSKVKGVVQPMDVYSYTLDVEFVDGTKATKTGDITLIR